MTRDSAKIVFGKEGYRASIFPNGAALFNDAPERPDIFIGDKQLPGRGGLQRFCGTGTS